MTDCQRLHFLTHSLSLNPRLRYGVNWYFSGGLRRALGPKTTLRTIYQIEGHWHPSREERTASHPSLTMSGTRAKAATGSAHDLCQMTLMLKPARAIHAIYAQREDWAAPASRAALEVMAANCRFWLASQGIATAAANKIPIPTRLRCASRYPRKFRTEVSITSPANAKRKTPAIRAARASLSSNRNARTRRLPKAARSNCLLRKR